MDLTKRQKQIFDFICDFHRLHGRTPAIPDIQQEFELSSKATVHQHLKCLEQRGYIAKSRYKQSSIVILQSENTIPLKGTVQAGYPVDVFEQNESVVIPPEIFGGKPMSNCYALEVRGDSMIEDCILDGDLIVVEQKKIARNGEIVVACVEGEVTLKRFFQERDHIRLQPANSSMEPIIVRGEMEILGILVGLFRRY
jgi:repressor LexA